MAVGYNVIYKVQIPPYHNHSPHETLAVQSASRAKADPSSLHSTVNSMHCRNADWICLVGSAHAFTEVLGYGRENAQGSRETWDA